MTDTTPAQRLADHAASWLDGANSMDSTAPEVALYVADLRAVLADNARLERELEELSDFDRLTSDRQKLSDERDRAVQRWHDLHKENKRLRADRDRAEAELARHAAAESAGAAAGSYAGRAEAAERELAEVKAKLAAASWAAAASAELDAELTAAKRRLEVAYRREDDLRGAYEAAWAERNEARCMAHSLYAMLAQVAEGYAETIGYDPRPDREALPDWLADAEPPAVDAGSRQDGAQEGQERDNGASASRAAGGVEIEP